MQTTEYFTTIVYAKLGGQTECIMDNWKIVKENSLAGGTEKMPVSMGFIELEPIVELSKKTLKLKRIKCLRYTKKKTSSEYRVSVSS